MPIAAITPKQRLRARLAVLACLSLGLMSAGAATTVTVTQRAPLEIVTAAGAMTGVQEASPGAHYTLVSFASGEVTVKDPTGLYRIAASATDYVPTIAASPVAAPPASAAEAANPARAPAPGLASAPTRSPTTGSVAVTAGATNPDDSALANLPVPAWSEPAEAAWWKAHPTLDDEEAGAAVLRHRLAATYKLEGSSIFNQGDFRNWLDLYLWVELAADKMAALTPDEFSAFVALGQDHAIAHTLVENLEPPDERGRALRILIRLAQANRADLHEFASLGVAFALVFDTPFPSDWPHAQVAHEAVPLGDEDPVTRFAFYVAANRAHQLDTDLTQLGFDQLKFVVDSKISLSELTWAQQHTANLPYAHFGDAFFSIAYDQSRIEGDSVAYNWPSATYRLQDINQLGGICIDQAYYACMVGKARGIPTLMFSGLGDEGAHAWFGFLDQAGTWQLDCGRYENQNFSKGYATDPQTWQELKDTDLQQEVKNGINDPAYPAAHTALMWARVQGNDPAARPSYEDAHTIMPNLAEAWRAEADYLDASHASIDDEKAYYAAWIAQVGTFPDQRVVAQRRLIAVLRKANDPSADSVEQDIILQNRSGGIDLAVQGANEEIDYDLKGGDAEDARLAFERAVRDFGESGGATFFYRVVEPYWRECMSHGLVDQAGNGIRFMEDRTSLGQPAADGIPTQVDQELAAYKKRQSEIEACVPLMQAWLQQIDTGEASQAWSSASATFQAEGDADKWGAYLAGIRQKAGHISSRNLVAAFATPAFRRGSQLVQGPFVSGKFECVGDAGTLEESVIFQKSPGQDWQAFAYSAKPAAVFTPVAGANH